MINIAATKIMNRKKRVSQEIFIGIALVLFHCFISHMKKCATSAFSVFSYVLPYPGFSCSASKYSFTWSVLTAFTDVEISIQLVSRYG